MTIFGVHTRGTRLVAAALAASLLVTSCQFSRASKDATSATESVAPPTTQKATTTTSKSTTTSTTTSTTALPPRPVVSSTQAALVTDPPAVLPSKAVDIAVKPDDSVARMAINTLVNGTWTANIYALSGVDVSGTTQLAVDGASEALLYDVAVSPTTVAATGGVVTGAGESRGVFWSSPDGAQFTPGEILPSPITRGLRLAIRGDDVPVVVGWAANPGAASLIVARREADGWVTTVLVDDASTYDVNGVVAIGQTVVITGSVSRGQAGSAGVVWTSTDGGVTFQLLTAGLEEFASIHAPIAMGNTFVAMTEARGDAPTKMMTSVDGVGWVSTGLALSSDKPDADLSPNRVGSLAVNGDTLILSVSDLLSTVAVFGLDGRGVISEGLGTDGGVVYSDSIPYVLAGQPFLAFRSSGGFALSSYPVTETSVGHREGAGPTASGLEFLSLGNTVVASSFSYPIVTTTADGRKRWGGKSTFNVKSENSWILADTAVLPPAANSLASNGALDLWMSSVATDPADDAIGGPAGGTEVRIKASADAAWPAPQLIATGPGGDRLLGAAGFQDGFLTVGHAAVRSESGDNTTTPLIAEYLAGTWTFQPPPTGAPPEAWLHDVYVSGDGEVLATGGSDVEGFSGVLLFTRDGAGAWSLIPTPFTGNSVSVVDTQANQTGIVMLVYQEADWFQYTYDAGAFTSSAIKFDGTDRPDPSALVEVDGTKYLVGTSSGNLATHLAVWKIDGENATAVEWPNPVMSIELSVEDVIVQGTHILVGGTSHGQNVVWDLTIGSA